MLFHASEMDVEFMKWFQQGAEGGTFGHLGEGVDILGEALAAVAVLAIGTGYIGMRIVDVARQQHAGVHLAPVGSHLLAVFAAGVEVGHLVGSEDVVHILGELGLEGAHHGELLAHKNACEQLMRAGEDHRLLAKVLNMRALGKELGHITHLVACLTSQHVAGAREDGGADEDGDIGKFLD